MKLINNWKYWVFALIGWLILILSTLTFDKVSYGLEYADQNGYYGYIGYLIAEGIACGLLAYAMSFILLYYIEKHITFGNLKKRNVVSLVLLFIGVQIVYSLILWPMLDVVQDISNFQTDKNLTDTINWFMRLTNIPFFSAMFVIWIFIVLVIKAYDYNKNITLKQFKLEGSLKESQLNSLKGQINPHFMFNSLNNIRGLMLEDVSKSREMLTKLSEMLRYSLIKNDVNSIALEEEVDMVENYIALSKIQFEDRLEFVKEVDPNSLSVSIPPMIIQLLVENAAKHGIANLIKGGTITLITNRTPDYLHIIVRNTGKLKIAKGSTQLGLKNIKQRLRLLYGNLAEFSLEEVNDEVVANIKIPMV
ncbi:sensor histidine kinase [Cellulophaga omnivescoria]|uniref:sensor histidine kinase n=1 Tax=Cellulophaga omnivescoria TaxID=1888890 RepID=UPI000986C974|nr:histidine kinase [Cellulophaga omnivescoria]WBU88300.1 histidine kinase [Cellulophaga omnivescoria]